MSAKHTLPAGRANGHVASFIRESARGRLEGEDAVSGGWLKCE